MEKDKHSTSTGTEPCLKTINRSISSHSANRVVFYLTLLGVVLVSVILQVIVNQILLKYNRPNLGNDLFSKPPRQQHLVRFPSDLSYSVSEQSAEDDQKEQSNAPSVTNHYELGKVTVKRIKEKLKVSGKN